MGKSRKAVCGTLLCLLLAPGEAHAAGTRFLGVVSNRATGYFIIPQVDWLRVRRGSPSDGVAYRKVRDANAYGPHPPSRRLPLSTRENYYVFPLCGNEMKTPGLLVSGGQGEVRLICP